MFDTYGVIVYQEQVINILVKMAKFSYAEADNIRRAMAKKKEDIILKTKDDFIKRSISNGYREDLAINIYEHILKFASYGFNKAHSVSYAYISYQMAYLKVHYNALFTFELLNNSLGSIDVIKELLNELKKNKLIINHADINMSNKDFNLVNNNVYLSFKMIKNMKSECIDNILKERENGVYTDIYDFFKRTVTFLNKSDYLLLINSFSLSCFNYNINTLLNNLDSLINYGALAIELNEYALMPEIEKYPELDINYLREEEIDSYGFYISNHPASKYSKVNKIKDINNYLFKTVKMYVLVEDIKAIKTKKNEDMAFITGSDDTGKMEFTVFPKNFYMLQNLRKNDMIKIVGNVSKRFDKVSVIITNVAKDV